MVWKEVRRAKENDKPCCQPWWLLFFIFGTAVPAPCWIARRVLDGYLRVILVRIYDALMNTIEDRNLCLQTQVNVLILASSSVGNRANVLDPEIDSCLPQTKHVRSWSPLPLPWLPFSKRVPADQLGLDSPFQVQTNLRGGLRSNANSPNSCVAPTN